MDVFGVRDVPVGGGGVGGEGGEGYGDGGRRVVWRLLGEGECGGGGSWAVEFSEVGGFCEGHGVSLYLLRGACGGLRRVVLGDETIVSGLLKDSGLRRSHGVEGSLYA